jgi:hypothetical protein
MRMTQPNSGVTACAWHPKVSQNMEQNMEQNMQKLEQKMDQKMKQKMHHQKCQNSLLLCLQLQWFT